MEIRNEFIVRAPARVTWDALVDVPRVALCLPGARLTDTDGDVYSGVVKLKVGPITTEYAGKAGFIERDDAAMRARIEAKGAETRGAGTASALITTSLTDGGDHTVVLVETDLNITGRVAQFGRGMIAEIAGGLLKQFSANLEQMLDEHGRESTGTDDRDSGATGTTDTRQPGGPSAGCSAAPTALDASRLLGGPLAKRAAPVLAVLVGAALAYLWVRARHRR